jgi:citrate synthase
MTNPDQTRFVSGLEGVVAAQTRLSHVDGQRGELIIAGFPVEELAANARFEEVAYLLFHDRLPSPGELDEYRRTLAANRTLPVATVELLRSAARAQVSAMDALRMAAASIDLEPSDDLASSLIARFPAIVAAYWRLRHGHEPVAPHPELDHAANYLYMLTGAEPPPERSRALETYLNTVSDHGLNASTFVARVIISTDSDLVSAITGAIGALKGPKHGGAPGPALELVFESGSPENAEPVLRAHLDSGERLMGVGHRVYKVRDPRAEVLGAAAERLYTSGQAAQGGMELFNLARHVENAAVRLLEEYKPGRNLQTNVEFYTALVLHGIGLETDLFTPTFAIGRVIGWIAHCFEQQATGRLIRPSSQYVGDDDRRWPIRS